MKRPSGRRRTVRDWTPDLGDGDQWLTQLEAEGWTPEYGAGVHVQINGQPVVRYALIETGAPHPD